MNIERRLFLKWSLLTPLYGYAINSFGDSIEEYPIIEKCKVVMGKSMTYLVCGSGDPVVFLHGNPTRAYLWRKIFPHIQQNSLCIAPDLIGMGSSEKLGAEIEDRYSFGCHARYLDNLLLQIIPNGKKVIMVGHDWGGVLAIDWAKRHADRVKGIAFMETFLEPHQTGSTPQGVIDWFKNFASEDMERAVLENNFFVENVFLKGLSGMTNEDREMYRNPYKSPGESRLPTLIWPRQVPIDGLPKETTDVFTDNMNFMLSTGIPKLFINADPGALLGSEARRNIIRKWPNLKEVVVRGNHFIQEQCPDEIGRAISTWIQTIEG